MALTESERAEALAQAYRAARHRVDSDGGNLHTMRRLLGPGLYRARVAEELLMVIATLPGRVPDATVRAMATGLNGLLLTDPDLNPPTVTPPGVHTATACQVPGCGKWHEQAAADAPNERAEMARRRT